MLVYIQCLLTVLVFNHYQSIFLTVNKNEMDHMDNGRARNIVFFGTSLTEGYGLEIEEAYPALIGKKIDSAGLNYKVYNEGLSGETTQGGKMRINEVLKTPVDIFVLELGANDGLGELPLADIKKNLKFIIQTVKNKYPKAIVILAGMQIPPMAGSSYPGKFQRIFYEVSRELKVILIPFLLENVGGVADLNFEDGLHPNAEGHKIMAENVWKILIDHL